MPLPSRSRPAAFRSPAPTSTRRLRRRRRGPCARRAAEALALPLDVTDDAAVAGAVAAAEERLGGLGLVAALAAIEGAIAPIEEYDPATFDRVLAVNVRGVYLTLRHALPALRRVGTGSVVTVASQAGLRGVPGLSGYVASKHAVVGLTKGVALEAARDGIRVNCVCPGPTDTRMMRDIEDVVRAAGAIRPASSTASRSAATASPRRSRR